MNHSPDFTTHNAEVYHQSLSAFRGRRRAKRIIAGVQCCTAIALSMAICFWRNQPPRLEPKVAAAPPVHPTDTHFLSDEQLLANFPPGSCFLAEVDGRKVIVFRDPAVRQHFLN